MAELPITDPTGFPPASPQPDQNAISTQSVTNIPSEASTIAYLDVPSATPSGFIEPSTAASDFDILFTDQPSQTNIKKSIVKEPVKRKRTPPKREVSQSHHHHHVIDVDSSTDFSKMNIDRRKVNFLPYNPPAAISQTGLIQSIGKPFNPNHARHLPDPGDEFKLTRRVSQVRLQQIQLLGDVKPKLIDGLAASIKLLSILIGVSSVVFFGFIIAVASVPTPMEYPLYFLDANPVCKAIHIAGVVQPMAVAPYCRYALINLKHVRSYFLRVPLLLGLEVGVVLCGFLQFTSAVSNQGEMNRFLKHRMEQYHNNTYISRLSRSTWDGIQNTLDLIRLMYRHSLAAVVFKAIQTGTLKKITKPFIPNHVARISLNSGDVLKREGCKFKYKSVNISIALIYCILGAAIIVLEIFSVVFMRSLYACIGHEVYDERSSLIIACGKFCSLCDIEDTDEELEYDDPKAALRKAALEAAEEEDMGKDDKAQETPSASAAASNITTVAAKSEVSVASTRASNSKIKKSGMGRGITGKSNKVAPAT